MPPMFRTVCIVFLLFWMATSLESQEIRRGDANLDGTVNLADSITTLQYLFLGEPLGCLLAADANDSETLNIADAIYLIEYLFVSGPLIPPPFPNCGADPTPGPLTCFDSSTCGGLPLPVLTASNAGIFQPGDVVTLSGTNFFSTLEDHRVSFEDFAGVAVRGRILGGTFGVGSPPVDTLEVVVPSRVQSGSVELESRVNGDWVPSGGVGFDAAPVILGYAIDDDGQGLAVRRNAAGVISPGGIQLIGYNLGDASFVLVSDGVATVVAPSFSLGLPPSATYAVPLGYEVLDVELPLGLIPTICETSTLVFSVVQLGAGGVSVSSAPVLVPFAAEFGAGDLSDIPAYITGAVTPAGIRAGTVEVVYNLAANPSPAKWDVPIEYQDPSDPTGNTFLLCTPESGTTNGQLPGARIHSSITPAIIGPGATQVFRWNTLADLPGGSGAVTTRLRIRPTNPSPAAAIDSLACAGSWITDRLVIDNGTPLIGSIVEDFETNSNEDPSGTALWNSNGSGVLVAGQMAPAFPAWGDGSVDVVMGAGGIFEIDTDFLGVFGVTDPLNPIDLVPVNPGIAAGEFHLRSLVVEAGALLSVSGDQALMIRCSGDSSASFVALRIDGDIDLAGGNGTAASFSDRGLGGTGVARGAAGGDGGFVTVDVASQSVLALAHATSGGSMGGEAGQSTSYVAIGASVSIPRAGPGGGGGHATRGESGVNGLPPATSQSARVGRGGVPRGDTALTRLHGGGGGGGGGATPVRLSATSFQSRHGGGGGAGGGAFGAAVRGAISISGSILCNGGDGATGTAGTQAGAGGGGAGGSIFLAATGSLELASSVSLSAQGGLGGITSPSSTNPLRGGNGAPGRIRLESNGPILTPGSPGLSSLSISPAPSVASFETAGFSESLALSLPYPVTLDGERVRGAAVFQPAFIQEQVPILAPVRALFEGAYPDATAPDQPGEFFGLTDDLSLLDGVEYIRARIFMYATQTVAPVVESFEIDY